MSHDLLLSPTFGDDHNHCEPQTPSSIARAKALSSIKAGHPFSLLLAEDDERRAAALEWVLDTVADPVTRFARATNPLRARLTLERLLIQVIDGPVDPYGPPAELVRHIAAQRQDERRVILVIERAETLHVDALRFLGQTAALFPAADPSLQVLFVGRPEFRTLLDDPQSGFGEQKTLLEPDRPREPEPLAPPFEPAITLPQRPPPATDSRLGARMRGVWARGLLMRVAIVAGVLIGITAIGFAATLAFTVPLDAASRPSVSSLAELPDPAQSEPDAPVLQPGPPVDEANAVLRREFNAYLVASGKTLDGATATQRRGIYSEFLVWRARTRSNRASQ